MSHFHLGDFETQLTHRGRRGGGVNVAMKGQLKESHRDKSCHGNCVHHDPLTDAVVIVIQTARGFNEMLNVNVAFLADPKSSQTQTGYISHTHLYSI